MTSLLGGFGALAAGYFSGAIPFGYLLVRLFYRQDIRELGSHNPGATNVWRCFGKWPGMATLALDILKGFLPVFIFRRIFSGQDYWPVLCGISAITGHNWSLFLRGKGGKGVATSAGVFLALLPRECGLALGAFLLLLLISKRVSISSMGAAIILVIFSWFFPNPIYFRLAALLTGVMILIKHLPNMKRLINGDEPAVKLS